MISARTFIENTVCDQSAKGKATRAKLYRKCSERNAILPGESVILSPLIIPKTELDRVSRDCAILLELILHLAERVFHGSIENLLETFNYPASFVRLVKGIYRPLRQHMICRLDTYISEEGLKILEMNAGPWVGGLNLSRLFKCLTDIPAVKSRVNQDKLTCREPFGAAMQAIVNACRARNVKTLALIEIKNTWKHSETAVAEALDTLRHLGIDAMHVTPSQLQLDPRSGKLVFCKKTIDGVCRLFPLSMMASTSEDFRPIISALQRGVVRDVMLSESWLVSCKAALAVLWDKQFWNSFTENERHLLKQYIPQTWHLSQYTKPLAIRQQNQVILKPIYGFSGRGVVCGWEHTGKQWKIVVEKALRSKEQYIVQRRVVSRHFPAVVYSADGHLEKSYKCPLVLGLFMAGGDLIGGYVRAHPRCNGVINVGKGAAVGAVVEQA